MALAFELVGQLGGVGGLTGALEAAHHDDGGRVGRHFQPLLAAAHESGQLLVDNLDDHLAGVRLSITSLPTARSVTFLVNSLATL